MAGCETNTVPPGNYDWSANRITAWAFIAGAAGAGWAGGAIALIGNTLAWSMLVPMAAFAAAGAGVGFWVGNAVEWFVRLKEQNPRTIVVQGMAVCAGKNTGIPPFYDNDWTFNLSYHPPLALTLTWPNVPGLDIQEVLTRAAPGSGQSQSYRSVDENRRLVFHCEIGSNIGDYSAAGGAAGSVLATIGVLPGCLALALFTFGLGALLCLLLVALAPFAGGVVGNLIGGALGWAADKLSDFDERGKVISQDCMVNFAGRWVTDKSHQHNEIHDIVSAQIIECGAAIVTAPNPLGVVGMVGIGRHPIGPDP